MRREDERGWRSREEVAKDKGGRGWDAHTRHGRRARADLSPARVSRACTHATAAPWTTHADAHGPAARPDVLSPQRARSRRREGPCAPSDARPEPRASPGPSGGNKRCPCPLEREVHRSVTVCARGLPRLATIAAADGSGPRVLIGRVRSNVLRPQRDGLPCGRIHASASCPCNEARCVAAQDTMIIGRRRDGPPQSARAPCPHNLRQGAQRTYLLTRHGSIVVVVTVLRGVADAPPRVLLLLGVLPMSYLNATSRLELVHTYTLASPTRHATTGSAHRPWGTPPGALAWRTDHS